MQRTSLWLVGGFVFIVVVGIAVWWTAKGIDHQMRTPDATELHSSPDGETPQPPTQTPQSMIREPLALRFFGDIMLDRGVWAKMRSQGASYPFRYLDVWTKGADQVIANLEGPVTNRGTHAIPNGTLLFKFEPSVASELATAGIQLVSLANNHTFNQGDQGYQETRQHLAQSQISFFGHPKQVGEQTVTIQEIKGWKIAWIGWNVIEVADSSEELLLDQIRALDSQVDIVLVYPHWGAEYRAQTTEQVRQAHALIDAGADIIIGAHPHTVQGIEEYRGKPIVYSLGNFIFDQYWSEQTQEGLSVLLTLDNEQLTIAFDPVDLHRSQPKPAEELVQQSVQARIKSASDTALHESIDEGIWQLPLSGVIEAPNLVSAPDFD